MAHKFRRPWLPMPRKAVVHRLRPLSVDPVICAGVGRVIPQIDLRLPRPALVETL
jgi:hypothetical protein